MCECLLDIEHRAPHCKDTRTNSSREQAAACRGEWWWAKGVTGAKIYKPPVIK